MAYLVALLQVMLNATILNGMGVTGEVTAGPVYEPIGENANLIQIGFEYSSSLWPWSGYLALYITVNPGASDFTGTVCNPHLDKLLIPFVSW